MEQSSNPFRGSIAALRTRGVVSHLRSPLWRCTTYVAQPGQIRSIGGVVLPEPLAKPVPRVLLIDAKTAHGALLMEQLSRAGFKEDLQ